MQNVIVDCDACGQRNRLSLPLPAGKVARCGACKALLGTDDDLDPEDVEDDDDNEGV